MENTSNGPAATVISKGAEEREETGEEERGKGDPAIG